MTDTTTHHYSPYYWLNKESRLFLSRGYLKEGQTAEERIQEIADNAESILGIEGFSKKFQYYLSKGFYSLSTPVWVNFGNKRGLPVSCFGSWVDDTMQDILYKSSEVGMMTKQGGGTSAFFGALRERGAPISVGGESSGPVHFMEIFDTVTQVCKQGSSRRGTFAAYLPVDHPDILEFLRIRDDGHPIQDMNFGVCISDKWMEAMIAGDSDKRNIWAAIVKKRFMSGYPYIFFSDNVNGSKPDVYKEKNMKIWASNVCSEIALPSSLTESFVCVLSSINVLHWDEIVKTDAIETLIYFLEAVNEEFVRKSESIVFLKNAHKFAKRHRALGMGILGWHSLLQSKMIPFESMNAKYLNTEIWSTMNSRANKASEELAELFGEPELLEGYGRRNTTLMTVAPTTSSSFILGQVSQSIEPFNSNYFTKNLAKGKFTCKNEHLQKLLQTYNKDTNEVWKSILVHGGSVQHLDFLSENEKSVFKTFNEISQKEIIIQAVQRQKFIDQSQSLNLSIPYNTPAKQVSDLMIDAWRLGIKTLYYQRGTNPAQELSRDIMSCSSCES